MGTVRFQVLGIVYLFYICLSNLTRSEILGQIVLQPKAKNRLQEVSRSKGNRTKMFHVTPNATSKQFDSYRRVRTGVIGTKFWAHGATEMTR
jgi:hypothetical protein